ncbi:MAG: hypothetical protein V4668_04395 [Patescibacteria group bacterium]
MKNPILRDEFTSAINNLEIVEVTYNSVGKGLVTQELIPLDFGPWRRYNSGELRYHFYSTSTPQHPIPLKPEQIIEIKKLEKKFDPANIVHWLPAWHIVRDWGIYS